MKMGTSNAAFFRTVFILAALYAPISTGEPATSPAASRQANDEQVRAEIIGQAEKLKKETRKGDTGQFGAMIADDFAVFDPSFPFLLDPAKDIHVELERYWDAFDKPPTLDRSHKIQKIQVFGDVALLTMTAVSKGTPVGPGFMSQAKFLSVYEKRNGKWILVYTHDGRRLGPDGTPID